MAYPTNPKYKLVKNLIDEQVNAVRTISNSYTITIPFDEANTDYQEFLQWKADGGVPEEAD